MKNRRMEKKNVTGKYGLVICPVVIFSVFLLICFWGYMRGEKDQSRQDYGVFLSLDSSETEKITKYRTVVIDAQFFSKEDIACLKEQGCIVYSYINIGAIEDFRDYYDMYSGLALGDYENWDEEQWIDVSSTDWQMFLALLEEELLDKGIDGFFIDNCDVYYEYPTEDIFTGLTTILKHLMEYDKPVIVNGGDAYVLRFQERYGSLLQIMTGVNQESVWSKINFDTGAFLAREQEEREYFQDYIETCKSYGLEVYLLEYTTDNSLMRKIKEYCEENDFHYYIADSIELD